MTEPAFIRGELRDSVDPESLPLRDPGALRDVQALPFDEIVDYLAALGERLTLAANDHLREALAHCDEHSELTLPLMRASFEQLPSLFTRESVREVAELTIGTEYADGWVERRLSDGRTAAVRPIGARAVHIIAGNSPLIAALSIIRNAIVRSDAIIKAPSNDPLTALAIARTMGELDPSHPITKHLAVAYWKGGDVAFEARLYRPQNIEKIVAWGGLASVSHVVRYIQPGLELITLDPKRSATIIGPEAFGSADALADVAHRTAVDVGALNQAGCVNARVVYVASGTDADGVRRANELGERIYSQLVSLPEAVSTPVRHFDPELRANLDALKTAPDFYRVIGGIDGEGAVIVSQLDQPVEFHRSLSGRVANVVPVDDPRDVLPAINAYTQTIGIYPESLKRELRETLALHGAQRLVSLGHAADPNVALPQDAIEPVRRMARWIVDETVTTAVGG
ncbi:MAG TPA: acyl-CoA reductase [Solirubrobacteraceae bacterium]|nr:acyl-CoA reductase [Solirubrobacteraceae bacterium]